MTNRLRWLLRRAIQFRGRYLRPAVGFSYPPRRPASLAYYIGGGIGDAIMTYPALCLLKCTFPDAQLRVFVPKKPYPVLARVFEQFEPRAMPAPVPMLSRPKHRYDIAFSNTVAAFFLTIECNAYLSARHSYGFHYPDEPPRGRLYTATMPIADSVHDADQNIALITRAFRLQSGVGDVAYCRERTRAPARDAPVVLHPGVETGYDYKLWPVDRYNELAGRLTSRGIRVQVLLGPAELYMKSSFAESPFLKVVLGPGPQGLVDTIRSARLFVGNDSGPAHLAAFCGTPGITLIGPVNPNRTAPRGKNNVYIHNETACAPCHFARRQCADNRCMKSISVDQVWHEVERML
ncbi:MAG: hypothetical protein GF418_08705 [Chitinivibrionales bacterium]|nr:hypothetical protein [Chitinivibrionales bacterium]MBD3395692.1 hypothetical protein [Chitinivibrionales bacterium]